MRNWMAVALLCLALGQQGLGWGNDAHQAINRTAAEKIPATMQAFLRQAGERIEYLGPEPDRWRGSEEFALKEAQEPDHFIDLERIGAAELPPGRYEFYQLCYRKRTALMSYLQKAQTGAAGAPNVSGGNAAGTVLPDDLLPERVGLQPYITMEIFDRLKVAFRDYRRLREAGLKTDAVEQNIVFYMGWLGHYVGDGSNPLHTTIYYNGWLGANPRGYTTAHTIHGTMEGTFVAANLDHMPFAALVQQPAYLSDPWHDYLQYLLRSHTLVEKCYQLEKDGGFAGAGTPESREFIRLRLAAGSQMLLNLWYTAWVDSGKGAGSR